MHNSRILGIVLSGAIFIHWPISPCFSNVDRLAQKKIIIRILDEHGKPTAARIRVTGHDSVYYAPEGHRVDFPIAIQEGDIHHEGDVILDNTRRLHFQDIL